MMDLSLLQCRVQGKQPGAHSLRFLRTNTEPEQVDFASEGRGVAERAVVVLLRLKRVLAQERAAAAETADVGKQVEMIQGDVKCFHAAHRQPGHGTVIA